MNEKDKELERIEKALAAQDPLDDILNDEELNALLSDEAVPAFDDPEEIREPKRRGYQNFANNYGTEPEKKPAAPDRARDEKVIFWLMVGASGLCLGIIGVLGYWLGVLL